MYFSSPIFSCIFLLSFLVCEYVFLYPRVVPWTQVRAHMSLHPNHTCIFKEYPKTTPKTTVSSYSFATLMKLQFRYSCEATDSLQLKIQSLYLNREEDLDSSDFLEFHFFSFFFSLSLLSLWESGIGRRQGIFLSSY